MVFGAHFDFLPWENCPLEPPNGDIFARYVPNTLPPQAREEPVCRFPELLKPGAAVLGVVATSQIRDERAGMPGQLSVVMKAYLCPVGSP